MASGIAAGALALGAAGAYAANANSTIPVTSSTSVTLGSGNNTLKVVTFNGGTLTAAPANGFKNAGQCVSWLASNKNVALASTLGTSTKLPKSYHGKLMSAANAWCETQVKTSTKTDSAETETPDATQSETPSTDSTDSTAAQGNGHANGHGKHAGETH